MVAPLLRCKNKKIGTVAGYHKREYSTAHMNNGIEANRNLGLSMYVSLRRRRIRSPSFDV
jgi:hypothetical protein